MPEPPRLSSAIMAHPRRAPQVHTLVDRLTGFSPAISYHTLPGDVTLLRSAAAAWAAADQKATHHAVFQDDVVPHPKLRDLITTSVALKPAAAISAFCEWGCKTSYALRLAALAGYGFTEVVDKYVPTNAMVLPTPAAIVLSHRLATAAGKRAEPDDTIVKAFVDEAGIQCLVTVPNLTDDLALPSLADNADMGIRKAACFLPAELSAQDKTLTGLVLLPFFQWRTGRALVLRRAGTTGEWTRDALAPLLAQNGLGPGQITAMVRAATSECAGRAVAAAAPWLCELAQVTAALVLCAAGLGEELSVPDRLRHPVARTAWRSLMPGALRCLAPACVRTDLIDDLFAVTASLAGQTEILLRDGTLSPLSCLAS